MGSRSHNVIDLLRTERLYTRRGHQVEGYTNPHCISPPYPKVDVVNLPQKFFSQ